MSGVRLFFGILLALVALFAGGCGIYFFSLGFLAAIRGGGDDYALMWFGSLAGILPGLIAGVIALLLLTGSRKQRERGE